MRKHWINARLKPSRVRTKSFSSMPIVKGLCPSGFADYNIYFSLGLIPIYVFSSPMHVSLSSDISKILGSPLQPRPHLYSLMQQPLRVFCSYGLHTGAPLTHRALPWWLSKTMEGESTTRHSCILQASKASTIWMIHKLSGQRGTDPGLLNHGSSSSFSQFLSRSRNLHRLLFKSWKLICVIPGHK